MVRNLTIDTFDYYPPVKIEVVKAAPLDQENDSAVLYASALIIPSLALAHVTVRKINLLQYSNYVEHIRKHTVGISPRGIR